MAEYSSGAAATSPISHPPRQPHNSGSDDDEGHSTMKVRGNELSTTPGTGGASTTPASGGGSSSSTKKPRGRPPGSKNKPKPPMVITQKDETAMHVMVLEVRGGSDVVDAVSDFARRRHIGVSVIGGSGAVANVFVRHPHAAASTTYSLHGRFDIVTLSGTILPSLPSSSSSPSATSTQVVCAGKSPFCITVAGPQGTVFGGTVVGALMAAGPVVVVVATFGGSEFHRLPGIGEEGVEDEESGGGGGGGGSGPVEDVKPISMSTSSIVGVSYGSSPLIHSDVVALPWGPSVTRAPPPHHPLRPHHHHQHHF